MVGDRYTLESLLGRGGMAEVWRATDERLHRVVAIKMMAPGLAHDPAFLERFYREARFVARLPHPNIVSILDYGTAQDRPFLVMEHVPGGSLEELVGVPFEAERLLPLVAGAARGAGAAHQAGLVHRDVKPANILLTSDGFPKLADFGIAAATNTSSLTLTGQPMGSPHYISPERAMGRGASPASDVYSFGVVLYELATGQRPFEGTNTVAITLAHIDQEPKLPTEVNPALHPGVEAVIMRCLAKDPSARYPDGSSLATALGQAGLRAGTTAAVTTRAAGTRSWTPDDLRATDGAEPDARPDKTTRAGLGALIAAGLVALLASGALALWDGDGASSRPPPRTEQDRAGGQPSGRSTPARRSKPAASNETTVPEVGDPSPVQRAEAGTIPSPPASEKSPQPAESTSPKPTPSTPSDPSPTPMSSPSPEPSATPSASPTPTPTPSPEPSVSASPTSSPAATPSPSPSH